MQELIKHGATVDVYSYAPSALTLLHCALAHGRAEAARMLLLNGASSKAANGRSDTPLDVCLNKVDYTQTWTPHHQETIVWTLMEYHAKPTITTYRALDALPSLITHPYDRYLTDSAPVFQNRLFALITRQPTGSAIQQARIMYDYMPQPPALGVHALACFDTVYYLATCHSKVIAKNAWILAWKLGESRFVYTSCISPVHEYRSMLDILADWGADGSTKA
jgi:ankyrin repeat protein